MINDDKEIINNQIVSCTIDEAVMHLVGISVVRPEIEDDSNPADDLDEILWNIVDSAETEFQNTIFEKLAEDVVIEKHNKLKEADQLCTIVRRYRSDIVDELAKEDGSKLRIHKISGHNPAYPKITVKSLNLWAKNLYGISVFDFADAQYLGTSNSKPLHQTENEAKPWLVVNKLDPVATQPWYTPARYFARQLVKDDSTLLSKRNLLANKIYQSLNNVGIHKRGNRKPPSADTIKKALANVKLG